jgi:hypothetical protein
MRLLDITNATVGGESGGEFAVLSVLPSSTIISSQSVKSWA